MNTNYDDEATRYEDAENENTQYGETQSTKQEETTSSPETESAARAQDKPAGSGWKRMAVGAGSGLLIGGVATLVMGMKKDDSTPGKPNGGDNNRDELSHPEWVDDQVPVATTVSDDMSFGEAFAAARAEVGPGGCFEWHGQVYGTYTADEWNSMTAEQRAEYGDHFSWNHIDHSSSNVAGHSTAHTGSTSASTASHQQHTGTTSDDDIEVVSVNHDENGGNTAQTHANQTTGHTTDQTTGHIVDQAAVEEPHDQAEVVEVSHEGSDVEILGVVHDDETGANIGGMIVDGQEVVLIDVDNDLEFDYMGADVNGNGQIEQNELVNIQGQGLTVDALGGISNPAGDMMASGDTQDYSADVAYEG